mgnify:CR=1 FL=1|tara:strand:- start:3949 stop:4536 length:588 start_codon:yes stop_codon:yes gene_type:complete
MLEKIAKSDWQYLAPFLACSICFVATDFFGIIEKTSFAYWSGRLSIEPYRIFTSHFLHGDINHLLANGGGIVVVRYFLKSLRLKSDVFLFAVIALMIPFQTFICWYFDMFVFGNPMSLAIGFSGVLFGMDSFILMSTLYGKKRFAFVSCNIKKDPKLFKSIFLLTIIGILWSLLPGISLLGHVSGLIAGFILFWV